MKNVQKPSRIIKFRKAMSDKALSIFLAMDAKRRSQVFVYKYLLFAWRRVPLSLHNKIRIKNYIFRHAGFIFHNSSAYATWKLQPTRLLPPPIQPFATITVNLAEMDKTARELSFDEAPDPLVSIIIPMFDKTQYTLECLTSIYRHRPLNTFEIIVVDDGSSDKPIIASVPNIRYLRHDVNSGFVIACNTGASVAKGKYLLFLNNDTQVMPGWLDELVKVFDLDTEVGIVGSKLVYASGVLQEAGALLRRDGTAELIGYGDDPNRPEYNFTRESDYCSGASLMITRELFAELNGFSEEFIPAYCEDSDLCFRVRQIGKKVVYQPTSVAIHHLGVTTAAHASNKMTVIQKNQNTFVQKWKSELEELNKVRLIAFYLPQFHPIPENDEWWGKGFTEWTNVVKGHANFYGHYQPHWPADLGFYDLRIPEVREAQAKLAAQYGIEGFCYYYYWFGKGKKLLNRPLDEVIRIGSPQFPFCICWANENWTRRWDGMDSEVLMAQAYHNNWEMDFIEELLPTIQDSRYIRINGKPLLLVYNVGQIPDPQVATTIWRRRCRDAGVGEIYLATVQSHHSGAGDCHPEMLGFDAAVEFPPHGLSVAGESPGKILNREFKGAFWDYVKTAQNFGDRPEPQYKLFKGVMPSWDNTARQQNRASIFIDGNPDRYGEWLKTAIDHTRRFKFGDEKIVFINAWNEWAEGAHLEPDQEFGHTYLEKTLEALEMAGCVAPRKPSGRISNKMRSTVVGKNNWARQTRRIGARILSNHPASIESTEKREYRIGIGLIEHFGDIVACEPVSRYLRENNPNAYIAWVVRERYKELLEHNPNIDEVIVVPCLTDWIKMLHHKAFDRVVDLHVNNRVCPECNIPLIKKEGDKAVDVVNYYSYGSILESFCRGAGIPPINETPVVYIPRKVEEAIAELDLPSNFIVIHCRSNEPARDWEDEKWRMLANSLNGESGLPLVEVGASATVVHSAVRDLCGRLSFLETAEVIRRANLFIGIDSGPAHLANAVGTPGVILLGQYRKFKKYMPYTGRYADGSGAIVLHSVKGAASELTVDIVREAALTQLRVNMDRKMREKAI